MPPLLLFGVALGCLLLLAALAAYADQHRGALARWLDHPATYTLALSVYYTGWAYFGTGAALLASGVTYLSFEMGWSFAFLFGWPLLLKAIRFMKAQHVTTLPGAFSIRYGASALLSGLVAGVLVIALLPYIALQLQAIAFAVQTVLPGGPGLEPSVLACTVLMALFAILFGARQPDPTLRHPGIVAAMAVSGVVKLAAVAILAGVALWRFPSLFASVGPEAWPSMRLGQAASNSYGTWATNFLVSMAAVLMLPHVFHLAVVENTDERQVHAAKWGFPLYGWIFEIALIPIAIAGLRMGLTGAGVQAAILLVAPTPGLQLLAVIGGVAAATGMAIVTLIALANLLLIDVLLPAWPGGPTGLGRLLLPLRWALMLAIALASYFLWRMVDHEYLFALGIDSFVAVAQLAPAFFLGLVWPRLQLRAVVWGIGLSLVAWVYTGFLPTLAPGVPAIADMVAHGPWGLGFLRPQALFGIGNLPPLVHSFFWSTLLNLGAILFLTLRQPTSEEQEQRTREILAGLSPTPAMRPVMKPVSVPDLQALLAPYLGAQRARVEAERIQAAYDATEGPAELRILKVRDALERLLRGPLGAVSALKVIDPVFPVTEGSLVDVMDAYRKLEQLLELRQEDLANRLRELSVLNAASERLVAIEDPQGQLEAITDLLARSFHFDLVGAFVLEGEHLRRYAQRGFRASPEVLEVAPGTALEQVLRERRALVLTRPLGEARDPLFAEGAHSLAYVPLAVGERSLGLLACGVRSASFYLSEDFLSLLQAIANNLAISLSAAQHQQKEALLKAQYETTLANMSDAVRVSDPSGHTIFVNDAYVSLIEAPSRDEVLAAEFATLYESFCIRDAAGQEIPYREAPSVRARLSGQPQNLAAARMRSAKGREAVLDISAVPVLDQEGQVAQVVTVYRDITELYGLKEALEQRVAQRTQELATERDRLKLALADLQNLEAVKAAFINAVSHDLRIPLTGIMGYAEFIEDEIGGALSEENRQYAHSIIDAARRMTGLLNELLDFARMEAGRLTVEARPMAFSSALEQAVTTFRPLLDKKKLSLELDVPEALPDVFADPDRVIQVLSNLLSNAIKFTPEGGRLTVRAFAEGDHLKVEVSDTGIGIPPEDLPHMFERFYQTQAGTKAGGTGLGLSISKALVEAQGGQIGVRSQAGVGSTFWFTLPFPAEDAAA